QNEKHVVKRGESLSVIAKRHKMSVKQLMALNGLKSSRLKAGQTLLVHAAGSNTATANKDIPRQKHYVVKRGDTLDGIARKFNIATDDLQRWNNIQGSRILPGLKLAVTAPDEA